MKEDHEYIDELFEKELGAYEMGTASQGWAAVETGLAKKGAIALLKSSLWLKLVAGVSIAGLLTIAGIAVFTSDSSENTNPELVNNSITENYTSPVITDNNSQSISSQAIDKSDNNKIISSKEIALESAPQIVTELKNTLISNNISEKPEADKTRINQPVVKSDINTSDKGNIKHDESISHLNNKQSLEKISDNKSESFNIRETQLSENDLSAIPQNDNIPSQTLSSVEKENSVITPESGQTEVIASDIALPDHDSNHEEAIPNTEKESEINNPIDINPEQIYISQNTNNRNEPEEFQPITSTSEFEHQYFTQISALPLKGFVNQPQFATPFLTRNQSIYLSQQKGFSPLSRAVSIWYSPQLMNFELTTDDAESQQLLQYLKSGINRPSVINYGISLELSGKRFMFETGIGITDISYTSNYLTTDFTFQENTFGNYWDSLILNITSDSIFHIIGIDTTWEVYTQTDSLFLSDSISYVLTDTLKEEKSQKFNNTYKYLEIPLIAGYSINHGRFKTTVKGGVITSLLWKSTGQSLTGQSENDIYTIKRENFPTPRFDLYAGIETRFLMGTRYFLFGEAYYRKSVNPLLNPNNITYNFNSYGLKLGAGLFF